MENQIREISRRIAAYLESKGIDFKKIAIENIPYYELDFDDLVMSDYIIANLLLESYSEVIDLFSKHIVSLYPGLKLDIRIKNLPDSEKLMISEIRQEHLNKLKSFEGYVKSKTNVFNYLESMNYLCTNPSCHYSENFIIIKGDFYNKVVELKCCPRCKSGVELIKKNLKDVQVLIIEENSEDLVNPTQKVQSKEFLLIGSLTAYDEDTSLDLSSKVKITGLIREKPLKVGLFDYYIEVKHIEKENIELKLEITKTEEEEIIAFSKNPKVKDILLESFVPEVWGRKEIKLGLNYQLFGCALKEENTRDNINILVVGDPSCLPKGTKIWTKNGLENIENIKEVLTIDENGNCIEQICINKNTGFKEIYEIIFDNGEVIECSEDHKWFRVDDTSITCTKDLKIGESLFSYGNYKELSILWKDNKSKSKSIFKNGYSNMSRMSSNMAISETNWGNEPSIQEFADGGNKESLFGRKMVDNNDREKIQYKSQSNKEKVIEDEYRIENSSRTDQDKLELESYEQSLWTKNGEKSCICSWKKMWAKEKSSRIFEDSQRESCLGMYDLPSEQYENGFSSTSHRLQQQEQFSRKSYDTLSILSYKITSIRKTEERLECYDLIVPDTNNFILENGLISHNCGKSVLAKGTIKYHPRGLYTSGENSSGVGLVGAVVQDPFLKKFTVEAGFLQRANKGLAVIDEIDKMKREELDKLNTVLESQEIIHNKAGLFERTPIKQDTLCCANPKFGSFSEEKTLLEQIEFTSYFLTRFDLIFILKDETTNDEMEGILNTMLKATKKKKEETPISKDFYKKYVYYSKSITPLFNTDAENHLKKFFLQLKPILKLATRQFGALTRLCEGAARMRLDTEIKIEYVKEVCDLFAWSVQPILKQMDDLSSLNSSPLLKKHFQDLEYESFDIITEKTSRKELSRILMKCFDYYKDSEDYIVTYDQLKEYKSFKDKKTFERIMEIVNEYKVRGEICEPRKEQLRLVGNQPLTIYR